MKDLQEMGMSQSAEIVGSKDRVETLGMIDYFEVTCHDGAGNFKWKETIKNIVTSEGLSYILQTGFTAEDVAIGSWYAGLKDTGAVASTDVSGDLPNVGNWTEYTEYDSATRPAITWGNTSGTTTVSTVSTAVPFVIGSPAPDVFGVFVVDASGKGTATSATVLYGAGDFGAQKVVDPNDTLNVTITLSATSA